MKKSKEETALTKARIVDTAARLLRERGLDGVSVAEIMADAGLTHGGFYAHFPSKEALCAAAITHASSETTTRLAKRLAAHDGGLDAFATDYVSKRHRASPAQGCVVAALASDAAHGDPAVRAALTAAVEQLVGVIEHQLDGSPAARARAVAAMTSAVGAVILARAVDDPALSNEILEAARAQLAR